MEYLQGLGHSHVRPGEGCQHLANVSLLLQGIAGEQQPSVVSAVVGYMEEVLVLVDAVRQVASQALGLLGILIIFVQL